jgi:hypothetical protein
MRPAPAALGEHTLLCFLLLFGNSCPSFEGAANREAAKDALLD